MPGTRFGALIPAAVLIVLGVLFLLDNLNAIAADSVWSVAWPSIMIVLGLWLFGLGPRFVGIALFALGLVFLGINIGILPDDTLSNWWPLFLIGGGVWLLLSWRHGGRRSKKTPRTDTGDAIDLNIAFGEADRSVTSKTFRGGSVTVKFGEANLDLRQADMSHEGATLDISIAFGEAKVRLPPTWVLRMDGEPVLGEIADRRTAKPSEGPVLTVRARVSFGSLKVED